MKFTITTIYATLLQRDIRCPVDSEVTLLPVDESRDDYNISSSQSNMDDDIRIVPFTDEEKARLNEKVRKMKFARPPPRLPAARRHENLVPSQPASIVKEEPFCSRNPSVDDSGISSCDSEKETTPVYHPSPSESFEQSTSFACAEYLCDGYDWIPEDSSASEDLPYNHKDVWLDRCVDLKTIEKFDDEYIGLDTNSNLEIKPEFNDRQSFYPRAVKVEEPDDYTESCPAMEISVDTSTVESTIDTRSSGFQVETIGMTSPIVYSPRLEMTLSRISCDLQEVELEREKTYGRFEVPQYGRLLISTSTSVPTLRYIMGSTLENLNWLVKSGGATPFPSGRSLPENVLPLADEVMVDSAAKVSQIEDSASTTTPKKKGKRKRVQNNSPVGVPPQQNPNVPKEAQKRKRTVSVVSTTSDAAKQSIKMVIRRESLPKLSTVPRSKSGDEAPAKRCCDANRSLSESHPYTMQGRSASASNIREAWRSLMNDEKVRTPIFIKIAPLKPRSSRDSSPTPVNDVYRNAGRKKPQNNSRTPSRKQSNVGPPCDDTDFQIVHEMIRKPAPIVRNRTSMSEEKILIAKLARMLDATFDISSPLWFELLQKKCYASMEELCLRAFMLRIERASMVVELCLRVRSSQKLVTKLSPRTSLVSPTSHGKSLESIVQRLKSPISEDIPGDPAPSSSALGVSSRFSTFPQHPSTFMEQSLR
ncbi:unnamed protein product [Nippostrongylus brasiliensis]|uniref:RRM domain-containing protein n=1 Tax=Nippostrongylus brasiliensis TaxID=27835 RepID=A0A0N4XVT8_NIPBR|nr:unnamed protein product [Nippostrongylus brasiliensis]